jgi:hypothetical protein
MIRFIREPSASITHPSDDHGDSRSLRNNTFLPSAERTGSPSPTVSYVIPKADLRPSVPLPREPAPRHWLFLRLSRKPEQSGAMTEHCLDANNAHQRFPGARTTACLPLAAQREVVIGVAPACHENGQHIGDPISAGDRRYEMMFSLIRCPVPNVLSSTYRICARHVGSNSN